jgi:hypothetical protein
MANRTKTYIAGDWDGDKYAIQKLYDWNKNKSVPIHFTNAHDLTQARDSSLNCSIKQSLKTRLDASKRFILIVGDKTASLRSGGCHLCPSYNSYGHYCVRRYYVDYRSYIIYECDEAVKAHNEDGVEIFVLYNGLIVDKNKCPESIRYYGKHFPMVYRGSDGGYYWNQYGIERLLE